MRKFVNKLKKVIPLFICFTVLGACSTEPEVISLNYEKVDYTITPLYKYEDYDLEVRYVDNQKIYGQIIDVKSQARFMHTVDLFSFDLETNKVDLLKYQNFNRIMDYIKYQKDTYYYEIIGGDEGDIGKFYRFVDGKKDEKLFEIVFNDMFNWPLFFQYNSSFILLVNNDFGVNIYALDSSNELKEIYSVDNLTNCIVATAKIEGDFLYIEGIGKEIKSLNKVNLKDGKCDLVLENQFDRFTITSSYIVLHQKNQEMIYNHEGKLLKIYEYKPAFGVACWTSKMKDDEIIVTDSRGNMYYRNLNEDTCYILSSEDSIIADIPVRFLTMEDSVIAESGETLYQIKINKK